MVIRRGGFIVVGSVIGNNHVCGNVQKRNARAEWTAIKDASDRKPLMATTDKDNNVKHGEEEGLKIAKAEQTGQADRWIAPPPCEHAAAAVESRICGVAVVPSRAPTSRFP